MGEFSSPLGRESINQTPSPLMGEGWVGVVNFFAK